MNVFPGLLLSGLLAIGLSAAGSTQSLTPGDAFRDACTLSRYDCTGIRAPMVRESAYVRYDGFYGVYFGGRTVWLADGLSPEQRYTVLVHEMVHYLQTHADENGPPFVFDVEVCVYEAEAFEVSNQVARRMGLPEVSAEQFNALYRCGAP